VDNDPGDAILTRTCRMLEAEYRGDVPLGTLGREPRAEDRVGARFRAKPKPRAVANRSQVTARARWLVSSW
jgi:hypothetical protein